MKILVTGGAGFIGSHLIDSLRESGATVLCVDSLDAGVYHGAPGYLRPDVDYSFVDLRHWMPDQRFADVEAIVHLAALGGVARAQRERSNILGANAVGTAKLVELATTWKQLRRFILVSSFSIYGAGYRYRCPDCHYEQDASRNETDLAAGRYDVYCRQCAAACHVLPIGENATAAPLEAYGASKYMQELCLRGSGLPTSIVRLSSVYGTRLRLDDGEATVIAKLAGWIRAGVAPQLFEDGRQLRDWVYVGDVVASLVRLLERPGEAVTNICSGRGTTLLDACTMLARILGRDDCQPKVIGGFRPGDMRHCLGDSSKMEALLGRLPVAFAEGADRAFGPIAAEAAAGPR